MQPSRPDDTTPNGRGGLEGATHMRMHGSKGAGFGAESQFEVELCQVLACDPGLVTGSLQWSPLLIGDENT